VILPTVITLAVFIIFFITAQQLMEYEDCCTYAQDDKLPFTVENSLAVERVVTGINDSTSMVFLGPEDMLILERETGKVKRITNGELLEEPLIDVNSYYMDGLIGVATTDNQNGSTYVFLYFNEAPINYSADIDNFEEADNVIRTLDYSREGDRLYRYEFVDNKLVNPKLLFSIPAPQPEKILDEMHHGGKVLIGPDNAVYLVIGDLDGIKYEGGETKAQNNKDGKEPDGRAGILHITQDGKPVGKGILDDTYPLNLYYAYGIRNSFGMDFDPVTGNLWDTENGPEFGDEINLVEPGFNSGYDIVEGMSTEYDDLDSLVDFNGIGKYSDPEFAWGKKGDNFTVAPTAIKFFNSDKFGKQYENDMFVADVNYGNIYHFNLNEDRSELSLEGPLKDKVADNLIELENIIFAKGFGGITDMAVGPDGYLYISSLQDYEDEKYEGTIFRIVPKIKYG
jgi:glucose/arabinose dehydrogenase